MNKNKKESCNNCEHGNNYKQTNCIGCNPPDEFNHFKQKKDFCPNCKGTGLTDDGYGQNARGNEC